MTHVEAWAELWSKGAIHIKGNQALAQATYASQYYILSSVPWKQRLSLPFSGVSTTGIAAGEFEKVNIFNFLEIFWARDSSVGKSIGSWIRRS